MTEPDILSSDIAALKAEQQAAWQELARPTLTTFDRRELRNRIRHSQLELRDRLKMRTERLRFRMRPVEPPPIDTLANIGFRLL